MAFPEELSPAAASFEAALPIFSRAPEHIRRIDMPAGEWIERIYPARHHLGLHPGNMLPDEATALELITTYETETRRLRTVYDLQVPLTYSEPIEENGGWYIRSLVELLDGEHFPDRHKWRHNTASLKQAGRLAVNLANYYTDVIANGEPTYIADTGDIDGYLATPHGPVRVDTDPMIWEIGEDGEDLHREIGALYGWAQDLPKHFVPQSLVKHLNSIWLR
jgi:hypothetical protein